MWPASPRLFTRLFPFLLVLALVGLALGGCQKRGAQSAPAAISGLPRPNPSYLAWLEQQSMLFRAPALAAEVSGTSRAFGHHGEPQRARTLLRAAPSWLWLNPLEIGGSQSLARQTLALNLIPRLPSLGLSGLFLAPLTESAAIWAPNGAAQSGWDGASLGFSAKAGTEEEIAALYELAETNDVQTGGELPPAATGIGPDFMLQARGAPRHGGLYAMVAAPQEDWSLLPNPAGEWQGVPVPEKNLAALVQNGVLPQAFARDLSGRQGGWAATGEIMGADGKVRRWLYRYAQNPGRPVLLWQDPSGAAKSVLSAAIIQQTGLLGQTLTGMRIAPLLGLEAGPKDSLEPGLEAAGALAREIHRYGGWAMQNDPVPLFIAALLLGGPLDFCVETETENAAKDALRTGDVSALHAVLRKLRSMPVERLARGASQENVPPVNPEQIYRTLQKNAANPAEEDFVNAVLLALAFRIGLPGLAMFSPAELGLPDFDNASVIPEDYRKKQLGAVTALLTARAKCGLALGKLQSVAGGSDGWTAALTSLPDGGLWLCAANYSPQKKKLAVRLPFSPKNAVDARTGGEIDCFEGAKVELTLDGNAVRNVLFLERQRN